MSTASKKKISKKTIFKILASVVLIGSISAYYLISRNDEGEVLSWMSSSWTYRRGIAVDNAGATELTNEDVLIELDTASLVTAGKMQNDCDDLRVTDSDTTTAINYWIESGCNTSTTQIWVKIPTLPSEGKTIYFYYGNETAINAEETWGGNLSLIYNTDCPTGWTRNNDLDDNTFLYGSAAYGTTDGISSHNHGTASCTTSSISEQTQCSAGTDRTHILATHAHTGLSVTVDTATVLPPYLDVVICKKNDEDIIAEANMITLFDDSLPAGWSNFSALNNNFPRGATSYGGTGGASTHTHTYTAGATTSSASSDYRDTEYFTPTHSSIGGHTHTSESATISSPSNIPPYLTMNFGQTSAQTYLPSNSIIITNALPPLGWTRYSSLDTRLPYGSTTPGSTGGTSSHTHSVTITSSGPSVGASLCGAGNEFWCALSTHTHTCTTTTSSQSNYPPYMTVIFAQKKESETTTVSEVEEPYNQTPTSPTDLYTEGVTAPTRVIDLTPEFSAIYNDPDTSDTAIYYQIQVNTASDFTGTVMWDSTKTSMTSTTQGTRSPDISYAGTTLSRNGSTYYWRIKFWDSADAESPWSSAGEFRMNTTPGVPTLSYTEGTTNPTKVADLTPEFSAIFNDADPGDTGEYYQILVDTSPTFDGTTMWFQGKTSMTSTPDGERSQDIIYNGDTLSLDGTTYYWMVKFWDNNGTDSTWTAWAEPVSYFTMSGPPSASSLLIDSQINPTLLNSASPVFSAICTDPNGDNCSAYQINVNSTPSFDGTELWDTGKTSTTITSGNRSSDFTYHGTPLTNSQNIYYWRIKFWDSDDNEGSWSSTAQFTDFYPSFKFEGIKLEGITIN